MEVTKQQSESKPLATGEQTRELTDLEQMIQRAWTAGYKVGYVHGFEYGVAATLGKGN